MFCSGRVAWLVEVMWRRRVISQSPASPALPSITPGSVPSSFASTNTIRTSRRSERCSRITGLPYTRSSTLSAAASRVESRSAWSRSSAYARVAAGTCRRNNSVGVDELANGLLDGLGGVPNPARHRRSALREAASDFCVAQSSHVPADRRANWAGQLLKMPYINRGARR